MMIMAAAESRRQRLPGRHDVRVFVVPPRYINMFFQELRINAGSTSSWAA